MSRFEFRLATLLKLFEQDRDEKRGQLGEAYHAERILQEQLQQANEELVATQQITRGAQSPGTIEIEAVSNARRYELVMQAKIKGLNQQMEHIRAEVERRREALLTVDREVNKLERLRENQHAAHERELRAAELRELDEIAGVRYQRREG